jgi:predicted XRE-type DNA-binding protein
LYKYTIEQLRDTTMQIRDISKPLTAKKLNESLASKFGYKLNLEQFTNEQLEDVRNKLRTKISQFEVSESYDGISTSPAYQKTRLMLDTVNQEITEREESEEDKCPECHKDPCQCDEIDEGHSEHDEEFSNRFKAASIKKKAQEHSVPESWINSAIRRIRLGESDEAELSAELTLRYDLRESVANYIVYIAEGEEDRAKNIMASKDMVDQITGWLEDTAAMKSEQLLELLDSIRETSGSDVAQQYQDAVKPALEAIYTALETSRQGLSSALAILSGGEAPTMGAPAGAPAGGVPGEEAMGGEEMAPEAGAQPPAPGMAPEAGREKRESVEYSRRLGMLLNSKKK